MTIECRMTDCQSGMKELEPDSIDLIVTDPPYFLINSSGSGFMGKEWESLNKSKGYQILCKSEEIANIVVRFLLLMKVESNTAEVNSVPENVNTKDSKGKKKSPSNVKPVEKNLKGQNHKSKVNTNSAHGFVLTKGEVLDMLNEPFPGHITAIENLNENVLFAIPHSLMERHLKNTALGTALKLPIEKICVGSETHLSLMDEVRINGVIEGMIGIKLENQSIRGMGMSARYAESIVANTKYRHITSSHTNKQKIIQWITSLLFVTNVMRKSETDYWQSLIYQFHKNWSKEALRVLKPGAFMFCLMTPRQDSLSSTINAIKEAGFQVDFTPIYWAYASGFPKAGNISKLVDKRLGVEREVTGTSQNKIHLENRIFG